MPNVPRSFKTAKQLQGIIVERIEQLRGETSAASGAIIGQLARAWDVLEERKRIISCRPKPRDIDVDAKGRPIRERKKGIRRGHSLGPTSVVPTPIEPPPATQEPGANAA